jgi:cytoskeletal protein RodZ
MQERAARWALMRERFNKQDAEKEKEKRKKTKEASKSESRSESPSRKRIILIVVGVLVLLLGGGAAIFFFAVERDIKMTADEVYAEFTKNTNAANQKFKGKFVQIRGKLTTHKPENKAEQLVFEGPADRQWHIVIVPTAAQAKELKAGQEVVLRGRFMPRKDAPDGNLQLSNCTIVK